MLTCFKRLSSTGEDSPFMRKLGNKVTRLQMAYRHSLAADDMVEKAVMRDRDDYQDAYVAKWFWRGIVGTVVLLLLLGSFILEAVLS